MNTQQKIFVRNSGLLAVLVSLICCLLAVTDRWRERDDCCRDGQERVTLLARECKTLLAWKDLIGIHSVFTNAIEDGTVSYAWIEQNGQILIHTFPVGVPRGLLSIHGDRLTATSTRQWQDEAGATFYDIAAPVHSHDAIVHLGISQSVPDTISQQEVVGIAILGVIAILLGSALSYGISVRTAHEIDAINLQLQAAVEQATRMASEAACANRAKSEFLANMSHEIRTPITAILGYADIAIEENSGRGACGHVEIIKRNGEHLLGLINSILDLSKVEAGQMQMEPVGCSPAQLAVEVVSLMRVRADAKGMKLQADLISPLPEIVLTDPLRLRQILVNLVGNAIKFTDQGAVCLAVRLTSDIDRPRLRFDVIDTGIGIDEEHLKTIFKPFTQVDNSSARKFGGTGLGLCISKHLAEALGGDIEVRSEPGKGSTFSLTIDPGPLEGVRMIENTQEALLHCPSRVTTVVSDKIELHGRILLAEDGPDNQRLISFLLKKAGADVVTVENGQLAYDEALASLARGEPFDVILMDMQMPVMDGYTATRRLRERGYAGPIIALTAHAMESDRQKCLDAGCDDYATKPIDRQKFLGTVAQWADRDRTNGDVTGKCAEPQATIC